MNHGFGTCRVARYCFIAMSAAAGALAGCVDEAATASVGTEEQAVEGGLPETCLEIKASSCESLPDGEYTLYVGKAPTLPWRAYCHGMSTATPREYLPLTFSTGDSNFSQETAGGYISGTDVRTHYFKLRIHPTTFRIDVNDQTFASSRGVITTWNLTSMPYGTAASCQWGPAGLGNIDLRGTPFQVTRTTPDQFVLSGWPEGVGGAVYQHNDQVVSLTGGGACGQIAPAGGELQLTYTALPAPQPGTEATCAELRCANPTLPDGEYILHANHDCNRPWKAYCKDMATNPVEYLPLSYSTGDYNFSQETAGGYISGSDVRTHYYKVRIDPVTFSIDTSDQTFASSRGIITTWNLTSMPYAVAASCQWGPAGLGNVDVRGTPFAVEPNQFVLSGWPEGVGAAAYQASDQIVQLTGGGACGQIAPSGSLLQLRYTQALPGDL